MIIPSAFARMALSWGSAFTVHPFFKSLRKISGVALLLMQLCTQSDSFAQQSSPTSPVITYQGMIQEQGSPITGDITLITILYSDPQGQNEVWRGQYTTSVRDGYFSLELGSGTYPLPSSDKLDGELWLGVIAGESGQLLPLTRLSASPFALNVADKSITKEKVAFDHVEGIRLLGTTAILKGEVNVKGKDGIKLSYDNASNSLLVGIEDSLAKSIRSKGQTSQDIFGGVGNIDGGSNKNIVAGGWFNTADDAIPTEFNSVLGGSDNDAIGGYATVGGGEDNTASGEYATIGGGTENSASGYSSVVAGGDRGQALGDYSFIGGGFVNTATGESSVTVGGWRNDATAEAATVTGGSANLASGVLSFVGGGGRNPSFSPVVGNVASGDYSAIGGGSSNRASGEFSFIGGGGFDDPEESAGVLGNIASNSYSIVVGGKNNLADGIKSIIVGGENNISTATEGAIVGGNANEIGTGADASFIGAGESNLIVGGSLFSVVAGGENNTVEDDYNIIGGGINNTISSRLAVIGGGTTNAIQSLAYRGFIGAGSNNLIADGGASSVIGGGETNKIYAYGSVITGGQGNTVWAGADYSVLGGGLANDIGSLTEVSIYSTLAGGIRNQTLGTANFLGGGTDNVTNDDNTVIGGGQDNTVHGNHATIGGGKNNLLVSTEAVIVGGSTNEIRTDADGSFIGAGSHNLINVDAWSSVIAGGSENEIHSGASVISGGVDNSTGAGAQTAVIGGGFENTITGAGGQATIAGGWDNLVENWGASIGGGKKNHAKEMWTTIPGGHQLIAGGTFQTVIGFNNKAQGASGLESDQLSTFKNNRLFIIGNGMSEVLRSNAFEVSNNGHSIVYDRNGTGAGRGAMRGATYTDNVMYAWGAIPAGGGIVPQPMIPTGDFGVASVTRSAVGTYNIVLNIRDADDNAITLERLSPMVTVQGDGCYIATVTNVANNSNNFTVLIHQVGGVASPGTCSLVNMPFHFHVTGRPPQ